MTVETRRVLMATALVAGLLLLAGVVLAAPSAPEDQEAAQAETVRIDPYTSTVTVGDTFDVALFVEGADDLRGFQADLAFDPDLLRIEDVTVGAFLEGADYAFLVLDSVDNTAGTALIAAIPTENNPGPSGDGAMVMVTMQALAEGTSPLDLSDVTVWEGGAEEGEPVTNPGDGVVVIGPCEPVAIDSVTSDGPTTLGAPTTFTATVTGSAPVDYAWDFDSDGTPELEGAGLDVVSHTYGAVGTYTVTLTVENCGGTETDSASSLVVEVTPCEDLTLEGLTSDSPVNLGEAMHFTATVSGSEPIVYTWDFGGAGSGTGESTATPSYTYDAVGDYTVDLVATNPCSEVSDTVEVVVGPVCVPVQITSLETDSPRPIWEPVHFTVTVTGTGPYTYDWTFGGPGSGTDVESSTPSWVYTQVGAYAASVGVENDCGFDYRATLVDVGPRRIFLPVVVKMYP